MTCVQYGTRFLENFSGLRRVTLAFGYYSNFLAYPATPLGAFERLPDDFEFRIQRTEELREHRHFDHLFKSAKLEEVVVRIQLDDFDKTELAQAFTNLVELLKELRDVHGSKAKICPIGYYKDSGRPEALPTWEVVQT